MKKSMGKKAASLILMTALMTSLVQPATAAGQGPDEDRVRTTTTTTPVVAEATPAPGTTAKGFATSTKYKYSTVKKRIAQYKETNKDVKGWLTVPGTNINEPVLYSNKDNSYYLYRDWKGENYPNITWSNFSSYPASAAYVDYRYKWGDTWKKSSKNTVIYGHNWTNLRNPLDIGANNNHTMFGQLPSYTDINFAKENPYIYYSTGDNEGIWKVFGVAYCELKTSFNYNTPNPSKSAYETLLKEWKQRSMFNFDVDVDTNDPILTLSTCTRVYNMGEDQRYVVVARLLRDGESEDDKVKVSVNTDMKTPQF